MSRPRPALIAAAFAAVWIIWGSTYLAIRVVLETLPPFLTAGIRFLIAGAVLYALARWRGAARPSRIHWRSALILGGLLFLGGNGAVMWAETRIPSGPAALMIATEPLMIALLMGAVPGRKLAAGLALGLAGVAVLIGPDALAGAGAVPVAVAAVLTAGCLCWAGGSLLGRTLPQPESSPLAAAMTMLGGGAFLLLAGAWHGDFAALHPAAVSLRSLAAAAYLVVFGSLVAFTAYGFLVRHVAPSRVATYAYVNPVVAVLLGAWLGGETLSSRVLWATLLIIPAVVMITLAEKSEPSRGAVAAPAPARGREPAVLPAAIE